jgi:hypothetical protein
MRLLRRSEPVPPSNVQLHYPDGRAVPVECVYDGEEDGQHAWTMVLPEAINRADLETGRLSITVETLPAKTSLAFPLQS